MIYIKNDRSVFPNNVKVSNQYENETRTIQFDLSDVQFTGNTYLICKYQNNQDFYTPLLLDSNFSIPVETFLSAQAGTYSCVIAISTATIGPDYDFSTDNPLFVSNIFTLTVDANFLTGTSTAWQLTPAAQNYFDQLIALVEKVQSDLDSGAFVGNGIQSITKISTSGLVDTYQITFTNGSTFDYQVTNGQNGQMPTITIQNGYWYINGVNTGQQAQGEQGDPGKDGTDGVGIQSIEKTYTEGNVDTYTITYTNQTTSTFTVTNGVTPNITIGTVTTLQPTEQATATITGTPENPVLNLGIPQGAQGEPGQGGSDNKLIGTVAKSENPSVTDSYNTELMNLKFYGKSKQLTTTGENKLGIDDFYNSTGKEKILPNGYSLDFLAGYYIYTPLNLPIGTYYATRKFSNSSLNTTNDFRIRDANDNIVSSDIATYSRVDDYTFKLELKNVDSPLYLVFNTPYGQQVSIYDIGVFEEYPFTYEIFTGGQPSPSPDYPQEITAIEQVSGNVVGVNLFDYLNEPYTLTFASLINENTFYVPATAAYGLIVYKINNDYLLNKNIKFYAEYTGSILLSFKGVDDNGESISKSTQNLNTVIDTSAFAKIIDLSIGIYPKNNMFASIKNVVMYEDNGTTINQYVPYTEQPFSFTPPQPLYSTPDGNVADVVNVESGKYEYNMSGAVVFDGSPDEAWLTNDNVFFIKITNMITAYNSANFWCNKYIVKVSLDKGNVYINAGFMYFRVDKNEITSVEQWKQYLQSNPITVVYPLATPTTEPIPQETLAILRALKSNTGVTNVICNAPVSFDYEQSIQIVIQNIWNAINNNTLSIETKG